MGQMTKVCRNNTRRFQDGGDTVIKLHNTEVVRFNEKRIVLNSGGWYTATTKARMNQAAFEYGLNFSVFQTEGEWFVRVKNSNKMLTFKDGMTIKR